MKKKSIVIALALCAALAVTGCGGKKDTDKKDSGKKIDISDVKGSEGSVKALDLKDLGKYITLGEYKGLEDTKTVYEVTDQDVSAQIDGVLSEKSVEVTDRPVQDGDIVNINFVGSVDGVEFEGGKGENYDLTIGSGQFVDGFETGLIGATKGQVLDVNTTFPDPYENNPDLAGKAAVFNVTVNTISQSPELTDEWVAANTEYKTVDEYKNSVKESIEKSNASQSDYYLQSSLFQKVQEASKIKEYPEDLVTKEVESFKSQVENMYAASVGMSLEDYITAQGYTDETFDELAKEKGKERLEQKMIVQAIMNAEKMVVSKEDYDKLVDAYVKENGFESKEMMIQNYGEETVQDTILWLEACKVLVDNAKINEAAPQDTLGGDPVAGTDTAEDTTEGQETQTDGTETAE